MKKGTDMKSSGSRAEEKSAFTFSKFLNVVKFVAIFAVAFVFGTSLDSIMAFFGVSFDGASASVWILIPTVILSFFFVLAFHEAGHILGGKLVGFRFMLFVVGPVKIYSTENGVRLAMNRSLAMAGGLGGAAPADSRNLTRRMMAYVAGGPVASFILAVASIGAAVVSPPSVGTVFGVMFTMSLFIGIATLIPNKFGGFTSDGARLLMLRRGGPEAERWAAISALAGASMAGVRPRDLDEDMIEKSLSPTDGSLDEAGARSTAHYHALDLGKVDDAESLLEPALAAENVPAMIRSQILLDAAFFRAHFRRDPDEARAFLATAKPDKALDKSLPLRVESAILLAEGDKDGAKKKATESLDALGKSLVAGTAKLEREWLEEILEASETRKPNTRESEDECSRSKT